MFAFDCGGWQTEGWEPSGIHDNIAGYLGFLDFTLDRGKGSIVRRALRIAATQNDKDLVVRLRVSEQTRLRVSANEKPLAAARKISGGNAFVSIRIPLTMENWHGLIESLTLDFEAKAGTFVEIDAISVQRG